MRLKETVVTSDEEGWEITLELTPDDLLALQRHRARLAAYIAECLDDNDRPVADFLALSASVALVTTITHSIEEIIEEIGYVAAPARAAKSKQRAAAGEKGSGEKVKHVYGDNGICAVRHDGTHTCGKIRERKPRKGSTAEKAVVAAESTGTLPGVGVEGAKP